MHYRVVGPRIFVTLFGVIQHSIDLIFYSFATKLRLNFYFLSPLFRRLCLFCSILRSIGSPSLLTHIHYFSPHFAPIPFPVVGPRKIECHCDAHDDRDQCDPRTELWRSNYRLLRHRC